MLTVSEVNWQSLSSSYRPLDGIGLQIPKEEGLPADVVSRLKSYEAVRDVPFKLVSLDNPEAEEMSKSEEEAECLVCQEEMSKERVSQLVCGHIFHKSCISSWLQRKASCPICRQAITKESIDGTACEAACSPDVEMAVMKRTNDTELALESRSPEPVTEKGNSETDQHTQLQYEQGTQQQELPAIACVTTQS